MAKLRAAECREFIQAVVEKAGAMGVPVSIAVVGPEGHLIAVERMDDAGFITPETAIAKGVHRCRLSLNEPALSRWPCDSAVVQGTQPSTACEPRCDDQWAHRGQWRLCAGIQG